MIKHMGKVHIHIKMAQFMLDNGNLIYKMGLEYKLGLIVQNIKGNIFRGKNMERGNIFGLINHNMMDNGLKIEFKEM